MAKIRGFQDNPNDFNCCGQCSTCKSKSFCGADGAGAVKDGDNATPRSGDKITEDMPWWQKVVNKIPGVIDVATGKQQPGSTGIGTTTPPPPPKKGLSALAVAGIGIAVVAVVVTVVYFARKKGKK